jgi:hypothetical protein
MDIGMVSGIQFYRGQVAKGYGMDGTRATGGGQNFAKLLTARAPSSEVDPRPSGGVAGTAKWPAASKSGLRQLFGGATSNYRPPRLVSTTAANHLIGPEALPENLEELVANPEKYYDLYASSEAYWRRQPLEVQKLREIQDPWQRRDRAVELAHRGYQIDPAIMIWGWDPLRTMLLRRLHGYTWVPSALQPPILARPGFVFPGVPTYDPHNPPPGSVPVEISFAVLRTYPRSQGGSS